jgi:hypothetical protein
MKAREQTPEFTEEEIALRMNAAVRRALSTPPKPLKEMTGKGQRAPVERKSRVRKAARSRPKSP